MVTSQTSMGATLRALAEAKAMGVMPLSPDEFKVFVSGKSIGSAYRVPGAWQTLDRKGQKSSSFPATDAGRQAAIDHIYRLAGITPTDQGRAHPAAKAEPNSPGNPAWDAPDGVTVELSPMAGDVPSHRTGSDIYTVSLRGKLLGYIRAGWYDAEVSKIQEPVVWLAAPGSSPDRPRMGERVGEVLTPDGADNAKALKVLLSRFKSIQARDELMLDEDIRAGESFTDYIEREASYVFGIIDLEGEDTHRVRGGDVKPALEAMFRDGRGGEWRPLTSKDWQGLNALAKKVIGNLHSLQTVPRTLYLSKEDVRALLVGSYLLGQKQAKVAPADARAEQVRGELMLDEAAKDRVEMMGFGAPPGVTVRPAPRNAEVKSRGCGIYQVLKGTRVVGYIRAAAENAKGHRLRDAGIWLAKPGSSMDDPEFDGYQGEINSNHGALEFLLRFDPEAKKDQARDRQVRDELMLDEAALKGWEETPVDPADIPAGVTLRRVAAKVFKQPLYAVVKGGSLLGYLCQGRVRGQFVTPAAAYLLGQGSSLTKPVLGKLVGHYGLEGELGLTKPGLNKAALQDLVAANQAGRVRDELMLDESLDTPKGPWDFLSNIIAKGRKGPEGSRNPEADYEIAKQIAGWREGRGGAVGRHTPVVELRAFAERALRKRGGVSPTGYNAEAHRDFLARMFNDEENERARQVRDELMLDESLTGATRREFESVLDANMHGLLSGTGRIKVTVGALKRVAEALYWKASGGEKLTDWARVQKAFNFTCDATLDLQWATDDMVPLGKFTKPRVVKFLETVYEMGLEDQQRSEPPPLDAKAKQVRDELMLDEVWRYAVQVSHGSPLALAGIRQQLARS